MEERVEEEPAKVAGVSDVVLAAGGVVWRKNEEGEEVLLIHRPKYDDWTLPKGKLDDGEGPEEAAVREVEEETGFRVSRGAELPSTRYRDSKGRNKRVRYWAMEPLSDDGFIPNAEIDDIRWLPVPEAVTLLSYEHDRPVVDAFEPPPSG